MPLLFVYFMEFLLALSAVNRYVNDTHYAVKVIGDMSRKNKGRTAPWRITILGQPYSKANSRKLVLIKGMPRSIKSDNARRYREDFLKQCPVLDPLFEEDVCVEMTIYYASRKPDLDESLILDCLQDRAYRNDRQVKHKHIHWGLDPDNPRTELRVWLAPSAE